MPIRRRHPRYSATTSLPPIVHLWLLRLLVPLGGHREFIQSHGFKNDTLAEILGLGKLIDPEVGDFDHKSARIELRKQHLDCERKYRNADIPSCLQDNSNRLSKLVGLSEADRRILEFTVMLNNERLLDDTADWLGQLSSVKVFHVVSAVLDITESEVRNALAATGVLAQSGLVTVSRTGTSTLRGKLDLLSDNFADHIYSSESDPVTLLRDTVSLSSSPVLEITDYDHITPSLNVLRPYLRHSVNKGRGGVNIFMHGDPGTGKSQLAKVLAAELGCELFEVASEDGDGDPVNGDRRLRAFRAAQSFFAQRRALILFDEVEDVFNDGDRMFGRKSTAQTRKAWINRMLEENPVPTLWLSNSIHGLDPAFIRRFDMVLELPIPPKRQRERILKETCADLIDPTTMGRIAEAEVLAPAVVTKAAAVVRTISEDLGAGGTAAAFELLIGNTLDAQGHPPISKNDPNRLPEVYDPAFIHADTDLKKVAAGLVQARSGRLCLYGPPGTGKTAFGRWLAQEMRVPLLVKRASDLMSMFVGEQEKNIARAFRQAEQDGALLLIDEVDSFLQDRRGAQRSWEVSEVNEMLTQMEAFAGVFVASTNLMSGLDQAALRRFDLKVHFDFLRPDQARDLFLRYCEQFEITPPESGQIAGVMRLKNLTPGDFAAVGRRGRFHAIDTPAMLLAALETECTLKEGAKSAIGFM
jgi:SpoVK/Ycf46/Vps4 family AAA+-type ATPase